jgi:hypothetical protein
VLGSRRIALLTCSAVTLVAVACSGDSSPAPGPTRALSTAVAVTGGRGVPTLAPELPSTPSPPPPEEPTATPTLATSTPPSSQPTTRIAPVVPAIEPTRPATPPPIATPRVVLRPQPSITSITSPVNRGSPAIVTATSGPGLSCSIRVTVPGGVVASANGLGNKLTDGSGKVTWSWVVGPATPIGTGQVAIRCGQSEEASAALIIR